MAKRPKVEETGGWITQTTEIVFAKATGDPWERIERQAREDMAHHGRLFWAVESMKREQAWELPTFDGASAGDVGGTPCDHCGRVASNIWRRTPQEQKAMRGRKVKGSYIPVNPEAFACAVHLPYWRESCYSPYIQGANVAA